MKRYYLLAFFLIPLLSGYRVERVVPKPSRPNIIFVFTDDLAYQAISAYGFGLNNTPNIDRLARQGMLFSRCVVTNSICGPSRATILTGKYSHMNGFYRNERGDFDSSQQTFPKLLQQNGYQTAIIGKWHLGSKPTGFDHWEVMRNQGSYYNPDFITPAGDSIAQGHSEEIVTGKAINWMDQQRDKSKPFMLMVQFKAPHREWEPGPGYMNKYDNHVFPEPPTLFDNYSGRASAARNQKMSIAKDMVLEGDNKLYNDAARNNPKGRSYARMNDAQKKAWDDAYSLKNEAFYKSKLSGDDLTRWKYQRYMQDYMSVVAGIDDNVGRLLDYLDKQHLAENTMVVFCSDQGFYLGEHGWFDKRWMYEQSFRTPLLVRWPGKIKPGSVNKDIVSNLDMAETFLDAAGVAVPADMQGRSLLPVFAGKKPADWRKSFYYHYYEGGVHGVPEHEGVYMDSLKLINYYTIGEWEMFDLRRDPYEMHSVYNNPEYTVQQQRLAAELAILRKQLNVPENKK
ncbi:MAG: sulfatase [Chitinophagaceae bacterium]